MPRRGDLRYVLVMRPAEFDAWSASFTSACLHALNGEVSKARSTLRQFDERAVAHWYHFVAQNAGRDRVEVLRLSGRDLRPITRSSKTAREKQRMPDRTASMSIFERDKFRCRYCHSPVVPKPVLRHLSSRLGIDLDKKRTNLQTHGAHWLHCATIDHLAPHADGGSNDAANLATSCYACQFGKGKYKLEELGLQLRPSPPELRISGRTWSAIVRDLSALST